MRKELYLIGVVFFYGRLFNHNEISCRPHFSISRCASLAGLAGIVVFSALANASSFLEYTTKVGIDRIVGKVPISCCYTQNRKVGCFLLLYVEFSFQNFSIQVQHMVLPTGHDLVGALWVSDDQMRLEVI